MGNLIRLQIPAFVNDCQNFDMRGFPLGAGSQSIRDALGLEARITRDVVVDFAQLRSAWTMVITMRKFMPTI
ncbi:MAG: hypothetical protein JSS24_15045 [Proteobacteria bacterium]|nr:hypothetical protein [Pseudomonadota bacterium]